MPHISISPLSPHQIEPLITLAHRIWHAHYPGIISREQIDYMLQLGYTPQLIRQELEQGVVWLVITSDDTMVGFAALGPHGESCMKLHKLYLLPDYHGQGIGARALAEVERLAREAGAARLVLNVNKHNSKAISAYRRAGWQVAEQVVVEIGNGFVMDDYVMTKDLVEPGPGTRDR